MEGHQKWMGFRTIDIIKYGEEIVTEGMDNIWGWHGKRAGYQKTWKKAITILVYKKKGKINACRKSWRCKSINY